MITWGALSTRPGTAGRGLAILHLTLWCHGLMINIRLRRRRRRGSAGKAAGPGRAGPASRVSVARALGRRRRLVACVGSCAAGRRPWPASVGNQAEPHSSRTTAWASTITTRPERQTARLGRRGRNSGEEDREDVELVREVAGCGRLRRRGKTHDIRTALCLSVLPVRAGDSRMHCQKWQCQWLVPMVVERSSGRISRGYFCIQCPAGSVGHTSMHSYNCAPFVSFVRKNINPWRQVNVPTVYG